MKTLYIKRFKNIDDGTIGEFKLFDFADKNNEKDKVLLSGYTLEPAGPDTTTPNQDKRIPAGAYTATWSFSPSFKRSLPLLFNELVSKTRRILIHGGNFPKDTLGCILIGGSFNDRGILKSKDKLNELIKLCSGSDFKVIITNLRGI